MHFTNLDGGAELNGAFTIGYTSCLATIHVMNVDRRGIRTPIGVLSL
jgi:hypothetical protein